MKYVVIEQNINSIRDDIDPIAEKENKMPAQLGGIRRDNWDRWRFKICLLTERHLNPLTLYNIKQFHAVEFGLKYKLTSHVWVFLYSVSSVKMRGVSSRTVVNFRYNIYANHDDVNVYSEQIVIYNNRVQVCIKFA